MSVIGNPYAYYAQGTYVDEYNDVIDLRANLDVQHRSHNSAETSSEYVSANPEGAERAENVLNAEEIESGENSLNLDGEPNDTSCSVPVAEVPVGSVKIHKLIWIERIFDNIFWITGICFQLLKQNSCIARTINLFLAFKSIIHLFIQNIIHEYQSLEGHWKEILQLLFFLVFGSSVMIFVFEIFEAYRPPDRSEDFVTFKNFNLSTAFSFASVSFITHSKNVS